MRFLEGKSGRLFNIDQIVNIEEGGQITICDKEGIRHTIKPCTIFFANGKNTHVAVPREDILNAINHPEYPCWNDDVLSLEELQQLAAARLHIEWLKTQQEIVQEEQVFDPQKEFKPKLNPALENVGQAESALANDPDLAGEIEQPQNAGDAAKAVGDIVAKSTARTWSPAPKPNNPEGTSESNPD